MYKKNSRSSGLESVLESDIHYLNVLLLKRFITETGQIIPARVSGVSAKKQRLVTEAIKLARLGKGSLVCSLVTNDMKLAEQFVLGAHL